MLSDDCGLNGPGALFTDLYELTMVQSYLQHGMSGTAVFELFFRSLPTDRNFIVAAGLDRALGLIEELHFTADDLAYLAEQPQFTAEFVTALKEFRFTGEIHAVPEGTIVFPDEPIVQIVAPLPEAQIVETLLLNQLSFASLAATKAARCVIAADGRQVVDFGSRRAHGIDAALTVARASYLAGAAGTSLVEAGKRYGIPIFGTMAHSYIQAHDDELKAFRNFAELYPHTTLLVDTYDTLSGVRKVVDLHRQLGDRFTVGTVRLDSGELAELGRAARSILDAAGLSAVKLFASGGLDEFAVQRFIQEDVPFDGFGIGTALAVSDDAPGLDTAYKLVEYDGQLRTKLSSKKVIYPGRKQIFRQAKDGRFSHDLLAYHPDRSGTHQSSDTPADRSATRQSSGTPAGAPLLVQVMKRGHRTIAGRTTLEQNRRHAQEQLAQLPTHLRQLRTSTPAYPVEIDKTVQADLDLLRQKMERNLER